MCKQYYNNKGPSAPSIDDIVEEPGKLETFMGGMKRTIINEIGHPINSFDFIVAVESPQTVNIGSLLARQFDLPFAVIKKDQRLPGEALWQHYDDEDSSKILSLRHEAVYPASDVLLVAHQMDNGNVLSTAENML